MNEDEEARKRRRYQWGFGLAPVAMVLSAALGGRPVGYVVVLGVITTLIAWFNIRAVRFCRSCGRMIRRGPMDRARPSYCRRCASAVSE